MVSSQDALPSATWCIVLHSFLPAEDVFFCFFFPRLVFAPCISTPNPSSPCPQAFPFHLPKVNRGDTNKTPSYVKKKKQAPYESLLGIRPKWKCCHDARTLRWKGRESDALTASHCLVLLYILNGVRCCSVLIILDNCEWKLGQERQKQFDFSQSVNVEKWALRVCLPAHRALLTVYLSYCWPDLN